MGGEAWGAGPLRESEGALRGGGFSLLSDPPPRRTQGPESPASPRAGCA